MFISVKMDKSLKMLQRRLINRLFLLMEEGAITSQGFGTFTLWPQSERTGRNPQTGSPH